MKICVTGGAGFIGSHLTDALLAQGHQVTVLDNLSMGRMENINPEAAFVLMDICSPEVDKLFEMERFDVLYHQAAQMDIRVSVANPLFDARTNILGSLNLLQTCVRHKVGKVLFASSGGAVYGEQDTFPCDEDHPTLPLSPYGVTKLTVEKYLHYYATEFGLQYIALRYANVYGPRQNPHGEAGVVAIFTNRLFGGDQPVINGDGKQTRDYVFVKDVVRANVAALDYGKTDIFNVGTGIETDVNAIFNLLNERTGGRAEEKHGPAKPGEQRRSVINCDRARESLGWAPQTALADGLTETVDFFRRKAGT